MRRRGIRMRYLKKDLFIVGVFMIASVLFACSSKEAVNTATEEKTDKSKEVDTEEKKTDLKISQEKAIEILKKALEGEIREGELIRYDHDEVINDMEYYVFQYYNPTGTIAWLYVNQSDESILKWDLTEDDPVAFISGETTFVH